MVFIEIDLKWPVASRYVLRPVARAGSAKKELALHPADDATITYQRPLEREPSLYAEFAKLDGSEQSCLEFAQQYGLLIVSRYPDLLHLCEAETLSFWRAHIKSIRDMIALCELGHSNPAEAFRQFGKREFSLYGDLELSLSIKSPRTPPSIDVRSTYLLAAIELQAIQSIIAGRKSIQCIECSKFYEIGGGARRSLSKFCSQRCKDTYHNRLKALKRSREK
jgi:hypothetical protein